MPITPDPLPGNLAFAERGARFGYALFGRARFGDPGASGPGDLPIDPDLLGSRFGFARFGTARFSSDLVIGAATQPGGLTITEDTHV